MLNKNYGEANSYDINQISRESDISSKGKELVSISKLGEIGGSWKTEYGHFKLSNKTFWGSRH